MRDTTLHDGHDAESENDEGQKVQIAKLPLFLKKERERQKKTVCKTFVYFLDI